MQICRPRLQSLATVTIVHDVRAAATEAQADHQAALAVESVDRVAVVRLGACKRRCATLRSRNTADQAVNVA